MILPRGDDDGNGDEGQQDLHDKVTSTLSMNGLFILSAHAALNPLDSEAQCMADVCGGVCM